MSMILVKLFIMYFLWIGLLSVNLGVRAELKQLLEDVPSQRRTLIFLDISACLALPVKLSFFLLICQLMCNRYSHMPGQDLTFQRVFTGKKNIIRSVSFSPFQLLNASFSLSKDVHKHTTSPFSSSERIYYLRFKWKNLL